MADELEKIGTLFANGKKVAPKTWFSQVIDDNDPTKTLEDIIAILKEAFKQVSRSTTGDGIVLTFTKGNNNQATVVIPNADSSHKGVITAPMYRKVYALPTEEKIPRIAYAVIGLQTVEYLENCINLHVNTVTTTDADEWQIECATIVHAGLMSAADKRALDGKADKSAAVGSFSVSAESNQIEVEIFAVDNDNLGSFYIPAATFSSAGVMLPAEKKLLMANRLRLGSQAITLEAGEELDPIENIFLKSQDAILIWGDTNIEQTTIRITVKDKNGNVVVQSSNVYVYPDDYNTVLSLDDIPPAEYSLVIENTGNETAKFLLYIQ